MVVIRLSRTGAKKRPFYHVVAKTKRSRRDGGCLERLGYFNPVAKGAEVRLQLDIDRIGHWLGNGAQTSDRVSNLIKEFKKLGARTGAEHLESKPKRTTKVAASEANVEASGEETPAADDSTAQATE